MSNQSPRGLFRKHASVIFMTTFGSLEVSVIVCIVLLLVSLDLLCAALNDLAFGNASGNVWPLAWAFRLGVFPLLLLVFWGIARRASRRVQTHIVERTHPRPVEVLVMFLSDKRREKDKPHEWVDEDLIQQATRDDGNLEDGTLALRVRLRGPWRMPLEAIAHHLERLKTVVVIPSTESRQHVEQFKSLVRSLTREHAAVTGRNIDILCPSDLAGLHDYVDPEQVKKHNGRYPLDQLDFENAIDQNTVLNAILDWLTKRKRVPHGEIMVDVTAGRKISSIVGTVAALGKDWSVEYVSVTKSGTGADSIVRVKEYIFTIKASDVTHDAS